MKPKLPRLLLIAVAVAVLAFGCDDDSNGSGVSGALSGSSNAGDGSGGSGSSLTASRLTETQYLKRANAICTEGREDRSKALSAFNRGRREVETGGLQKVYLPMLEDQIADLRALGAPRGDEEQVEEIILAFEGWIDAAKQLEGITSNPTLDKEVDRAGTLARKYGLKECSYG